ncbi:MAG: hypothetical protein KKD44_12485 [Proteobacteria bacterium]|nr:hypothetical protein [Pseudomonadota bacterium]
MKMLKWSLLVVVLVVVMGLVSGSTCKASDAKSPDDTVMTDDEATSGSGDYVEDDSSDEENYTGSGDLYEENDASPNDDLKEEESPEPESGDMNE